MPSEDIHAADSNSSSSHVNSPVQPNNVLSRIRRSLSTKSYFAPKLSHSTSQPNTPTINESPSSNSAPATPGGSFTPKRLGVTPFEKFVHLLRKKKNGKSPPLEFPPAHWEVDGRKEDSHEDIPLPEVPLLPEPTSEDTSGDESRVPPEPLSLAQRIQTMLSSFPPLFASFSSASATPQASTSTANSRASETRTLSLPFSLSDPRLVSLLSSPTVMNGSTDQSRPSVWSVLDRLKLKLPGYTSEPGSASRTSEEQFGTNQAETSDAADDSSVMLYAPLVPDELSEVEVARSELAPEPEQNLDSARKARQGETWPLPSGTEPAPKRVWVPSSTKLSLQVNWWGYRIYLPPSVLAVLDNTRLEGAKRAAIITTALKWALGHIPMMVISPQVRPTIMMLKTLIPYLGYIGAFVAWSWSAIKMFDKGNGVVLTATWLLPLALIPGTWEDDEYPEVIQERRANEAPSTDPAPSSF